MTSFARTKVAMALALTLIASPAVADSWSQAWLASPQAVWTDTSLFPTGLPDSIANATVRQPLTLASPAERLRLVLSNIYGTTPLQITAASVAHSEGAEKAGRLQPVLFGGEAAITIPPGAQVVSDPVAIPAEPGDRLAATLTFGPKAVAEDFHWDARETSYVIDADIAAPRIIAEIPVRIALSGVLTDHAPRAVVVAMGDSITDGNGAPMDAGARWPDFLAHKLAPEGITVVNAGISGARLLTDGMGQSVMARLDHDVLDLPGAKVLLLLIGTNDIGWPGSPLAPDEPPVTLAQLRAGLQQVAARAHASGMRFVVGTVPPFQGALPDTPMEATYWTAEKDALRRELNDWLRSATFHDGLVDFDAVLRDPADDSRLAEAYDSGDRLHPGAEGNEAMARAVSADILLGKDQ